MNIFGTEINEFPSYVSPIDTPTHLYQDMQETLARRLNIAPAPMAPNGTMENTGNQWDQKQ